MTVEKEKIENASQLLNQARLDWLKSRTQRNTAQAEKFERKAQEIRQRTGRRQFFLRYVLPVFISSALITAWIIGFMRPVLEEKEEYRLYQLRNLEGRLSDRADSLRMAAAKIEKEKLVMAKEFEWTKRDLLAIVDSLKKAGNGATFDSALAEQRLIIRGIGRPGRADSLKALETVYPAKYFGAIKEQDVRNGSKIRLGVVSAVSGDSIVYEAEFMDTVLAIKVGDEKEPRIFRMARMPFAVFISFEGARQIIVVSEKVRKRIYRVSVFEG
jgi:hypothetical protein